MTGPTPYEQAQDWLRASQDILVVTHEHADGDAVGSILGVTTCMRDLGINATPYLTEPLPDDFDPFLQPELLVGDALSDVQRFGAVLCLDSATAARVGLPGDLAIEDINLPIANIDHHADNPGYGDVSLIDAASAATAEILARLFKEHRFPVSSTTATMLLLGLITDTGGFRFPNTKPESLRLAAWLQEQGADHNAVVQRMYFNQPLGRLRLQARIIEDMHFAFDNRLAYFFLTAELLESCGVGSNDMEDLVDVARAIRGVELICRLQQTPAGVRYSIRSEDPAFPAIQIARRLGGGGHTMAAGALLEGGALEEAEALLLKYAGEMLNDG